MRPEEAVRGIAGPVGKLGGAFMFDAATFARGEELGMDGWAFYHCGRGGVLGDCDPSVVVAAFGFFPPHLQARAWDEGRAVQPVGATAEAFAECCVAYGAARWPDADPALTALLERVVSASGVAGMPVFAGWRALLQASSATGGGRLALALQVLREHRGGLHLVAVAAEGLDPLQAVVSGRYGAQNAEFFGWPQPYPEASVGAEAMARAEARTDALVAPALAGLTDDERAALVTGLRAL